MGILGFITNIRKKSEAALVVQNYLEAQELLDYSDTSWGLFANELVQWTWKSRPELFDGRKGPRPHKVAIAAMSLAAGLGRVDLRGVDRQRVLLSLDALMNGLADDRATCMALTELDKVLLNSAGVALERCFVA
ncbi:MAG: hypothetical protein ACN6RK_10220 [Stenotrophomonas sp.]